MKDFLKYTFKTKQNLKKCHASEILVTRDTKDIVKIYINKKAVEDPCQSSSGILYVNHTLLLLLENNILSRYI